MMTLAVTGGIGSGKSYVVRMFSALGIPVYDADSRTKSLYDSDSALIERLRLILGDGLVRDGHLDRRYMAGKLFSDRGLLERVEAVVFPEVVRDFSSWKSGAGIGCPFVIMESAIYLEKPSLSGLADKVLTVVCPGEVRIRRVMERSAMSREEVLARMGSQWTDARRTDLSDFVIVSDFSRPLLPQVYDVFLKMKEFNNLNSIEQHEN